MSQKNEKVILENTKFIFPTNFAGNPDKDKYGNPARRGNIIIPDPELAEAIRDMGINVRQTKPRPGEEEGYEPAYYMPIIVNYTSEAGRNRPPMVYLVNGDGNRALLDEETVGQIDYVYVTNVNCTIEIVYLPKYDKYAAYVRTMYVWQDGNDDPWAGDFE